MTIDEDELARITRRSAELEAEAEAAVPQKAQRPKVSEELRKKWAEQLERSGRLTLNLDLRLELLRAELDDEADLDR